MKSVKNTAGLRKLSIYRNRDIVMELETLALALWQSG
jgi:hypothetical protein